MIKSYFKIAWRNLQKNKLYSFVNIIGLTTGIVSCLLIGIYLKHELTYDGFNKNADKIVRVTMEYNHGGGSQKMACTGTKVGPQFSRMFPEIVDYVRLYKSSKIVKLNNQLFEENNFLYAEPSLFQIFSFKLNNGSIADALSSPDKMVISQTIAKKYFGDENPVGKTLKAGDKNYTVSAVAADAPSNSQFKFDFLVPFSTLNQAKKEQYYGANYITYLLLKNKDQIQPLQQKINGYMKTVDKEELKLPDGQFLAFYLEPLKRVHLYSNLPGDMEPAGSIVYVYVLIVVALLILIIACVNYVNLSVAQSAGRGAEISIRKVMGAARSQLFTQFIGEALLVTFIGVVLAIGISCIALSYFNQLSGIQFKYGAFFDPEIIISVIVLAIVMGLAAGIYPALLLSNAKLSKILKAGFSFTSGKGTRKSLIIFQFVISIFLIITTVVILQQLSYIRNKDIGYNKSDVVVLPIGYNNMSMTRINELKKEIRNTPGVESVATANNEPVNVMWGDAIKTDDGKSLTVNALPMDEDFIKTLQLKIIAGKDFDHTDVLQMDTTNNYKNFHYSFILNETAVRALGWTPEQAIGKKISKDLPGTIKAVVKDFNFKSFHSTISPLLIFLDYYQTGDLFVRITGKNTSNTIGAIENIWKQRVPERPFEYKFLDDDYDALYRNEQRTAKVFTTFSVLAILLACLGLFAITAFSVVQRTKEIGIRKVLGANISSIVLLISKDFLLMVFIAMIIASPVAWFMSNKWLQDFAYRIHINAWIFIVAGLASLVIAAVTISIQAIKAALANPVNSLKSE
ncbi:putative ABC transport system permease protein [Mucilaginibacter frigoritolerans]|uniref:Putative ABC transport system permease protein n=1 Tax=Mucilaginibacter frigoritolerans TaxID=652788 RepID=A0A562UGY7_9SPHI|nr:FtsX-like permease family protein [Mucilaginibacter frigoritolerans]TWJ04889.1 putative ABC transport system permease protein [Mucilaginibacter frigoritolerans]